jgi:hypothetical protein
MAAHKPLSTSERLAPLAIILQRSLLRRQEGFGLRQACDIRSLFRFGFSRLSRVGSVTELCFAVRRFRETPHYRLAVALHRPIMADGNPGRKSSGRREGLSSSGCLDDDERVRLHISNFREAESTLRGGTNDNLANINTSRLLDRERNGTGDCIGRNRDPRGNLPRLPRADFLTPRERSGSPNGTPNCADRWTRWPGVWRAGPR